MRLFVAVEPSPRRCEHLEDFLEVRRGADPDLRWGSPAQWHVTLAFMGAAPERRGGGPHRRCQRRGRAVRSDGAGHLGWRLLPGRDQGEGVVGRRGRGRGPGATRARCAGRGCGRRGRTRGWSVPAARHAGPVRSTDRGDPVGAGAGRRTRARRGRHPRSRSSPLTFPASAATDHGTRSWRAARCVGPDSSAPAARRARQTYTDVRWSVSDHPAPVAQRIEQEPSNLEVAGSSPAGGAVENMS